MSGYIVVDASLWVARLVANDVFHTRSRAWMEAQRAAGIRFIAPALLLVEVAAAISRPTGNPALARRAVGTLQSLADLRLVEMDRRLVQTATQVATDLGVRGADAFYIAVARQLNLPLATLDVDQR
ncbi:MAG: PIN domain-containing protein, partial [Gammaproteobacteria bacterium]